jgi:hypothetical protein
VSIVLNSDVLDYAGARDIIAIRIHHMIHAYFLVACGPQNEEEVGDGHLNHGHHFGKIITVICSLSAAHGKEFAPLNFGHGLVGSYYYAEEYYHPGHQPSNYTLEQKEKWYCSHYPCKLYETTDEEIDKWYTRIIRPMLDQPCKSIGSATV